MAPKLLPGQIIKIKSGSPTANRFGKDCYKSPQEFVYGVKVDGQVKAYSFAYLLQRPVTHEEIGGVPVLVTFDPSSTAAMIFRSGTYRFKEALEDGQLVEAESGSRFDTLSGLGTAGNLKGTQLEQLPGLASYRKAWMVFHPECTVVEAE